MYCRKKNRRKWRQRVAASRATHHPRGQSVATPIVQEWVEQTRYGLRFVDCLGVRVGECRNHKVKRKLRRLP